MSWQAATRAKCAPTGSRSITQNAMLRLTSFLDIWRRLMAGERVDHAGPYLTAENAELLFAPVQTNGPPLYLGGSSDPAIGVAGKHIDWYLTWGEPVAAVREKVARVRESAALAGRTVRFGIRLHVIVRETEEAAWTEADRLISRIDDDTIALVQKSQSASESMGQRRMQALHGGRRDRLVIGPNLWAGIGLVRGGAGTALVGSAESVAARIDEYAQAGIETFVLSGYPHLEEAYRVAELLFPLLPIAAREASSVSPPQPGRAGEASVHHTSRYRNVATGPS